MSRSNVRPSDKTPLLATIDPDAYSANTYVSDWVDMSRVGSILAVVAVGDELAASPAPTVSAKLEQALATSPISGTKDVTGKAITNLGAGDGDKQALINCFAEDLDIDNGFSLVRLSVTVSGTTSFGGFIFGSDPRYAPAAHLASVDEVV